MLFTTTRERHTMQRRPATRGLKRSPGLTSSCERSCGASDPCRKAGVVSRERLLLGLRDVRAPVLLPASLVVFRTCRPVFSIAYSLQLVAWKAERREVVFGLLGA